VSFKANFSFGGTEPKFEWKVNNVIVQSSTSNNFSSSILKDGDKVSCTLISNSDCASTNTVNSNTIEIQVKTAIQPSIQLNYIDDTLCREANLKLELIAQNLGAGTVYHWFKNGELVGQNAVLNIDSLMQGDEIWCNITTQAVNCGIEVSAISDTFQANVYPTPIFEVYQKGDTLFATEGFAAYSWFFNGRMIALGPDHFIVPEEPGIYTANVSDPNGCSGISVSINFVVTSIQNSINEAFKIYPNPSSGKIYMQFVRPTDGVIRMFQANGQQVLQPILIQGVLQYSIDISDFPSGMYMIMLEDSENIWSEKIIKMD
jgi:hypothetical protein